MKFTRLVGCIAHRVFECDARRALPWSVLLVVALSTVACHAPGKDGVEASPSDLAVAQRASDQGESARATDEAPTTASEKVREEVPAYRELREFHPDFAELEYFTASHSRYRGFGLVGFTHEDRPISAHWFRHATWFPGNTPRPQVVLLATIHGDEWAGTPLLERLVSELASDRSLLATHDITVIPVMNPDGYAAKRRRNARGVDLNRNFPAANARESVGGTPLSEPESHALHDLLLASKPDLVISIHQPVGVVDWDGPAEEIARLMSETSGLPAKRIGSRPGSLGSFLGVDHGVPVITLELPGGAQRLSPDTLWERYGETLLRAVESAESQRSSFS